MILPFNSKTADAAKMQFNRKMSAVFVALEWDYKDLKQKYSFNDVRRLLTLRYAPIALVYKDGALYLNMATCKYKDGQIGHLFECKAPTFDEYLTSGQNS